MPQVSEITVSVGLTINLGDYESLRRDVSVTVKAEDGDAVEVLEQYARNQANRSLANALEQDVITRTSLGNLINRPEAAIRSYLSRNPVFQALTTTSVSQARDLMERWIEQYAQKPAPAADGSETVSVPVE